MTGEEMIEKFQCPGCVAGSSPKECKNYRLGKSWGETCENHVIGTSILGVGHFALGLPKGVL
jgi:hypothetical protein